MSREEQAFARGEKEGKKPKKLIALTISGNGVNPKYHRLASHPGFCEGGRKRGERVSAFVLW